jgi:glutamine synthetase
MTLHADMLDAVLNNEIMLDGSSIAGFRNIETSDMYFFPDLDSFQILPWLSGGVKAVRIMCDIHNPDGTPFEGCPRYNLKRVIKSASELGYTYNVGPELEFFLFKRDDNGNALLETQDKAGYYELAPDDLGEEVRVRIVETLEMQGFNIEASHHEVAYGQHEIDFKYGDALTTADNVMNFKSTVRRIASEYGLHATFMPKPIYGINGSGMHCNQSLGTINGDNAFLDLNAEYQLSENCKYYIGGLLKHIRGISLLTNPTVNSYKRLVPGYEAPVYVAWSPSNRSALIRIPAKRGRATRIELRSPDPSCNPYLAFAGMLTAGLDGIKNKISAPEPTQINIYQLDELQRAEMNIDCLPGSLIEALYELKKSDIAKKALGEHIHGEFVKAKQREWDRYKTIVHQWEIDEYLDRI